MLLGLFVQKVYSHYISKSRKKFDWKTSIYFGLWWCFAYSQILLASCGSNFILCASKWCVPSIAGIRKIVFEAVKKPLSSRKSGVIALLYHIIKGPSSKFHSRAGWVLQLLTENSMFNIGDKFNGGKFFSKISFVINFYSSISILLLCILCSCGMFSQLFLHFDPFIL